MQDSILNASPNLSLDQKHYIRPCIYFNHYASPSNRRVKKDKYAFAQDNIGFYLPVYTTNWFREDQVSIASLHMLVGADLVSYRPKVYFLNESFAINRLVASGKLFYSDGKKSIIYIGINPFLSKHVKGNISSYRSITASFIYNRTVNEKFSYRLGITNSYTYGVYVPLPVLGMRIGALDKVHLNLQIPRNTSLDIPMGKKSMLSIFARSMGGIYNITLKDTLLAASGTDARLVRFEILRGLQFEKRVNNNIFFYIGLGFTSKRKVNFLYRQSFGSTDKLVNDKNTVPRSVFLNLGFSIRLGKAKQVYNNSQLYNLFELNTIGNSGNKDMGSYDNDIPADSKKYDINKISNVKYKDVEDLITDEY